jgi:hypothetical protein
VFEVAHLLLLLAASESDGWQTKLFDEVVYKHI